MVKCVYDRNNDLLTVRSCPATLLRVLFKIKMIIENKNLRKHLHLSLILQKRDFDDL